MLLYLRFIALAAAFAVGVSVILYILTGQTRFRRFAWRAFSVAAVLIGVVLLLLLAEHLLGSV
ncbi:MAG TPA: hypothetical protein VLA41_08370 [Burkholderiales bacterium]|nr:hypothetical protein [Burkholderiales bacterium]